MAASAFVRAILGQLSVAHTDATVDHLHRTNPFYSREALNASQVEDLIFGLDATRPGGNPECGHDISLAWTTRLGASVYATPSIVPASTTSGRAVWASTFVRYAETVDGTDGHELPGWPYAFARSTFHTSPIAYDVDGDGVDEMLLLSFEGELTFLNERGLPLRRYSTRLPKLRVRKDWYEGLHDIHTTPFKRTSQQLVQHDGGDDLDYAGPDAAAAGALSAPPAAGWCCLWLRGATHGPWRPSTPDGPRPTAPNAGAAAADEEAADEEQDAAFAGDIGAHGGLSAEAEASFGLFAHEEGDDDEELFEEAANEAADSPWVARWSALYDDADVLRQADADGYVFIDAHVLASPTLADVDGDGALELLVSVSYFVEEESAARLTRLGVLVDREQYVAGGVLALDPRQGALKWSVHLDLTTALTKLRAYIYAPVSVADLDGDGELEVAVGTSMGFLYVLSARDGSLRDGWPVQMNEIQGQVVPADVDGDGDLELLVVDAAGSVAAWRHDGSPLWEVQAAGLSAAGVTLVSTRGDGAVQVVVPTTAGVVHLLEGSTGRELEPFPLRTNGRILAPVLVVALDPPELAPPLLGSGGGVGGADSDPHLVFASFDGHVYVVNARSGCYDRIDIGEDVYTQVLADDLTGNGHIDLLVSTMNGHLYCFETDTPAPPLRAWRSQAQGRNGFTQRESFQGIVIEGAGGRHAPRAVSGARFSLEVTIHDVRRAPARRVHTLEVRLGPGPEGLLLNRSYELPRGTASLRVREELPCPAERWTGVLRVASVNEHGQYFDDTIAVSFNEGFEHVLKYVALVPFALTVLAVTATSLAARTPLPI